MAVRVIVVDDSALMRSLLGKGLARQAGIEVIGSAKDAYEARDMIVELAPDVITLDLDMPRMSGIEFIKVLMKHWPLPIVVVSGLTAAGAKIGLEALEAGAMEIRNKASDSNEQFDFEEMARLLKSLKGKKPRLPSAKSSQPISQTSQGAPLHLLSDRVIVIGASTGGTEAIKEVLIRLPDGLPGIVMVQHMPEGFTASFADRLNQLAPNLEVREAKNGDEVRPGLALLAPGNKQMYLKKNGPRYFVEVKKGQPVKRHMPSVDVLFESASICAKEKAVGVILTGMGADGAEGMLKMRHAGARTLAQDEKSCVVFGMPREALKNGGAEKAVPLEHMAQAVIKLLNK